MIARGRRREGKREGRKEGVTKSCNNQQEENSHGSVLSKEPEVFPPLATSQMKSIMEATALYLFTLASDNKIYLK